MKTLFKIITILISSWLYSQNNNTIEFNQIKINNTIMLGFTVTQVNSILGNPTSISPYYSEIDDETWQEHSYQGNLLYFQNNELIEFELKNSNFYVSNSNLKVGNNISVINTIYPNSYQRRQVTGGLGFITINITSNGIVQDFFITILYDPVTNKITSIHTASY